MRCIIFRSTQVLAITRDNDTQTALLPIKVSVSFREAVGTPTI